VNSCCCIVFNLYSLVVPLSVSMLIITIKKWALYFTYSLIPIYDLVMCDIDSFSLLKPVRHKECGLMLFHTRVFFPLWEGLHTRKAYEDYIGRSGVWFSNLRFMIWFYILWKCKGFMSSLILLFAYVIAFICIMSFAMNSS
jgi:hypothetical protein